MNKLVNGICGFAIVGCFFAVPAKGDAVRGGFTEASLPAEDDTPSSAATNIGFSANFFGTTYSQLYVNNNGNITFDGPHSDYTPVGLVGDATPIIAPFFADVDTRATGGGSVDYGIGTVDGHSAFGVTWNAVGYYGEHTDKLNTFQVVLIDRSDTGAGNFDFELNFNHILWETGDASGGSNGFDGSSAHVGYSNGSTSSFELPGSGVPGSFLDSNMATGLINNSLGTTVDGRYLFEVRSGDVEAAPVPLPATIVAGSSLLGLFGITRLSGRSKSAANV